MDRKKLILFACLVSLFFLVSLTGAQEPSASFTGNEPCGECHPDQIESYDKYSKKRHSGQSVRRMAGELTEAEVKSCFGCHTTGYMKPGGFVSFETTPEMADLGCETCHGPGSEHVDSGGDPELIKGKLAVEDCEICHNAERVNNFNFKPLLFGGAH